MPEVALKPEYGPTLARLLSPRWQRVPLVVRGALLAVVVLFVVAILGLVLTLEDAGISHGGPVPFGFSYKHLNRTAPDPGGYVKVASRTRGRLDDSFAVEPLSLPPYRGSLSGELPLYASGYIRALARRTTDFELEGEGKTRVNTVPGYNVLYNTVVDGERMFGRDVLLLPERPGVRQGVVISMLASRRTNRQIESASEIGGSGALLTPLHTFTFH